MDYSTNVDEYTMSQVDSCSCQKGIIYSFSFIPFPTTPSSEEESKKEFPQFRIHSRVFSRTSTHFFSSLPLLYTSLQIDNTQPLTGRLQLSRPSVNFIGFYHEEHEFICRIAHCTPLRKIAFGFAI